MATRIVKFERRYDAAGAAKDWVELCSSGNINETGMVAVSTWHRVDHMRPSQLELTADGLKAEHRRYMWEIVGPAYEQWLLGNEVPEHGTALAAWAGVTPDQADILRRFDIRSVEEMASVTDTILSRLPLPNARDLKRLANKWLSGRGMADVSKRLAELEAQNAALVEALAERDGEPAKRGPGRPRKDAEAA